MNRTPVRLRRLVTRKGMTKKREDIATVRTMTIAHSFQVNSSSSSSRAAFAEKAMPFTPMYMVSPRAMMPRMKGRPRTR